MDTLLRRRAMIGGAEPPTPPTPVYEPVFYDNLIFDGTAYIQTDIMPQEDCSITVPLGNETSKSQQSLFAYGNDSAKFIRGVFLNSMTSSTNRVFAARYNSTTAQTAALAFSTATYNFFLTPFKFGWNNTANNVTKGNVTPTKGIAFGINAGTAPPAYTGQMGTVRIYDSSAKNVTKYADFSSYTPSATLRPCTYNEEPGFWYVEGNKFFGNSAEAGSLSVSNDS